MPDPAYIVISSDRLGIARLDGNCGEAHLLHKKLEQSVAESEVLMGVVHGLAPLTQWVAQVVAQHPA